MATTKKQILYALVKKMSLFMIVIKIVNSHFTPSENEESSDTASSRSGQLVHSPITPKRCLPSVIDKETPPPSTRARKRKRQPQNWIKNILRSKRQRGELYVQGDKSVPAKQLQPACDGNCPTQCSTKFNDTQRKIIFDQFYNLGNKTRQWEFILKYVEEVPKKSCRNLNNSTKRTYTRIYRLPCKITSSNIKVCKTMFLNTLAINQQWVETAILKLKSDNGIVNHDARGSHTRIQNPTTNEINNIVSQHINALPRLPSHYCRANITREYLDSSLNIAKIYRLFLKWVLTNNIACPPVTQRQYRDIFNTKFNLGFGFPKKDLCNDCAAFDNMNESDKIKNQGQYNEHIFNKMKAREIKNNDKAIALSNNTIKENYLFTISQSTILLPRKEFVTYGIRPLPTKEETKLAVVYGNLCQKLLNVEQKNLFFGATTVAVRIKTGSFLPVMHIWRNNSI